VYLYQISVVIVNYNVEYFLEQCLLSVSKALEHVEGEVFVVDNNSKDNSVEMVRKKFPEYRLIANKDNVGFSKANNQAIARAKGRYILLLNPDTLIEEDTLKKTVDFMNTHADAGGLGVQMVDGKGNFLPESKRGLPTPSVAFYKIFGLSKLFPHSKRFGKYHAGYLDNDTISEIEVLSGAFMLLRAETLKKSGLLDETFFMYGEDIDLSYRITRTGYKNYYFPHTKIIHYKGESTKKSSVNYIVVFYRAMVIFANKHFAPKNAKLFSFLILCAIYFRAFLAIVVRVAKKFLPPIFDVVILTSGLFALSYRWEKLFNTFPNWTFLGWMYFYAISCVFFLHISKFYKLPFKMYSLLRGIFWSLLSVLLVNIALPDAYSLPVNFVFSALFFVVVYFVISRVFMYFLRGKHSEIFPRYTKRYAIIGGRLETNRLSRLLKLSRRWLKKVVFVNSKNEQDTWSIGTMQELSVTIHKHRIEEIIFCAKDISYKTIIETMVSLSNSSVSFKIAPANESYWIGSDSIDTPGNLSLVSPFALEQPYNQHVKRTVDLVITFLAILSLPVGIWYFSNKKQYLKNVFCVLIGKCSWVGYAHPYTNNCKLPKLKKGVLSPEIQYDNNKSNNSINKINEMYAKKYSASIDITTVIKSWKNIDADKQH